MFLQVSVHNRGGMHGCSWGGCVWLLQGGHAWLLWGGVRGCSRGACVVALGGGGVHGSSGGACVVALGGMHGCSGGCMVAPGGMRGCSQGGHAWLLWGGHAWFFRGGVLTIRDTVNERAVRILLECILVIH